MKISLLIFGALIVAVSSLGHTYTGTVTRIKDGDGFLLQTKDKVYDCRIWGIDAPELKQRFGHAAKSMLWSMIKGCQVTVTKVSMSYGRIVVSVKYRDKDIGLEMLKNGLAWYEKKYAPKRKDYETAMKKAQDEKRGLWFDDKPIRPTDFRHHKEQNLAQAK